MQQASSSPAAQAWRPNAFWLVVAAYVLVIAFGTNLLEIRYSYFTQEDAGSWGMSAVSMEKLNVKIQAKIKRMFGRNLMEWVPLI